jgi:hypothetical protein
MLRIETLNNVPAKPAPLAPVNTPGFFANNPGAGPGTVAGGDWFNRVQEEIVAPILAAGIALDGNNNTQLLAALRRMFAANGQCQLQVSSAVQLILLPKNGNILRINGASYAVPIGGVTIANTNVEVGGVSNSNLAANTDYLLYMKDDGTSTGVMVPSFFPLAGGHMPDNVLVGNLGVEVRNNAGAPDSTRSLVGLVCTNANAQFTAILTRSWFHRSTSTASVPGTQGSTVSAAQVEISTSMRVFFACFADDLFVAGVGGMSQIAGAGVNTVAQLSLDGSAPGIGPAELAQPSTTAFQAVPYHSTWAGNASEGRHFVTLLGNCTGGGTAYFTNQTQVAVR